MECPSPKLKLGAVGEFLTSVYIGSSNQHSAVFFFFCLTITGGPAGS